MAHKLTKRIFGTQMMRVEIESLHYEGSWDGLKRHLALFEQDLEITFQTELLKISQSNH